ncbi:hypothetical protein CAPTEDRAFT_186188 [Capitella teleta]|uniref:Receptor ligand binding region domain-containing protein n=1 Tax=Capitella teleta TaxID=283909 RepID=R7UCA9_CAPTE|nr:hypothetical protein CAPTEDRAFT_186188 [Capitella teleta]|eukprot:ELU03634.1 hypothetical protein CAPTEDRAFT_186188 [Capitella teleta]
MYPIVTSSSNKTLSRILHYNTECSAVTGTAEIIRAVEKDGVDVLIGGICSEGYYLRYWNIAHFSSSCVAPDLNNKTTFATLVRLFPSTNKLGYAITEMCMHYEWHRIIIFSSDGACGYGAESIKEHLRINKIELADELRITVDNIVNDNQIKRFLVDAKKRGRIFAICHEDQVIFRFMYIAHELGMTSSEYVYLLYALMPSVLTLTPWTIGVTDNTTQAQNETYKEMFRPYRSIIMADLSTNYTLQYNKKLQEYLTQEPWNANSSSELALDDYFGLFTEDATYVYLTTLVELYDKNINLNDGRSLFDAAANRSFQGASGHVVLDIRADRIPNIEIFRYDPETEAVIPFARVDMNRDKYDRFSLVAEELWGTADGLAPADTPACGFYNERCPPTLTTWQIILISVVCILIPLPIAWVVCIHKRRKFEDRLLEVICEVDYADITFIQKTAESMYSSTKSLHSAAAYECSSQNPELQAAVYKSQSVHVMKVTKQVVCLERKDLLEMKLMLQMVHENICAFVGTCVQPGNVCVLFGFCAKGPLQASQEFGAIA